MRDANRENEIALWDQIDVLVRYKWLLLAVTVTVTVVASFWAFVVIQPVWEASVTLDIGHVGVPGQLPIAIEPINNVMSRIKHPSFVKDAVNSADVKSDDVKAARADMSTLKVAKDKDSDLIELKLRAHSVDMARILIQGSVVNLQKVHGQMLAIATDRYNQQLRIVTEDIQYSNREIELLKKKLLANNNWNAFDATLSATVLQNKTIELRGLIQTKLLLEEALNPARTYNTKVFGEVSVSDKPVSPNKRLIIELAMLLGLLLAVFIALVHNIIAKRSTRNSGEF